MVKRTIIYSNSDNTKGNYNSGRIQVMLPKKIDQMDLVNEEKRQNI